MESEKKGVEMNLCITWKLIYRVTADNKCMITKEVRRGRDKLGDWN